MGSEVRGTVIPQAERLMSATKKTPKDGPICTHVQRANRSPHGDVVVANSGAELPSVTKIGGPEHACGANPMLVALVETRWDNV